MTMGFYPALLPLAGLLLAAPDTGQAPPPVTDPAQVLLQEASERMTVPVQIAGAGPYRFIIDTGAERTVISRQLATILGLRAGGDINVVAMSGTSRVGTVIIPSISLSTVPGIGKIRAPALDAAHLGGMGLLGIDTLQDHKVTIDFDAQTMSVTPSIKRKRTPDAGPNEIVVRAKSLLGQLIVTDADVDGKPVRVVLDTGPPVSVGNAPLRRLMQRASRRTDPMEMTSVTGGKIMTDYSRAGRLRLGGVNFIDMPIAFADVPPFKHFGLDRRPAMMLGMNALKMFRRVEIDFTNREARFQLPRGGRVADCGIIRTSHCPT